MATAADKRAKLQEKLNKLDPEAAIVKVAERQTKIQAQIDSLEMYKDMEGKSALMKIGKAGTIPVTVLGYERKVYGKNLFRVAVEGGTGSILVSEGRLQFGNTNPGTNPGTTEDQPEPETQEPEPEPALAGRKKGRK